MRCFCSKAAQTTQLSEVTTGRLMFRKYLRIHVSWLISLVTVNVTALLDAVAPFHSSYFLFFWIKFKGWAFFWSLSAKQSCRKWQGEIQTYTSYNIISFAVHLFKLHYWSAFLNKHKMPYPPALPVSFFLWINLLCDTCYVNKVPFNAIIDSDKKKVSHQEQLGFFHFSIKYFVTFCALAKWYIKMLTHCWSVTQHKCSCCHGSYKCYTPSPETLTCVLLHREDF